MAQEHELKAAFLYNFTKFVEWPPEAFPEPDAPFRICVVGRPRLAEFLEQLAVAEAVKGRPLEVAYHERVRSARGCQILFLAADEDPEELAALPGTEEGLVLTVGETESFLGAGGILRFRMERGRIRLQVSEPARERSRLRMSSKLLQLCDLVRPDRPQRSD